MKGVMGQRDGSAALLIGGIERRPLQMSEWAVLTLTITNVQFVYTTDVYPTD